MVISERTSRWISYAALPLVAGIVCVVASERLVSRVSDLNLIETNVLQGRTLGWQARVEDRLRVVYVTPETSRRLGLPDGGRIPRDVYARLLRGLDAAGARVALLDFRFEESHPKEDAELKKTLRSLAQLRVTLLAGYVDGSRISETPRGIVGRYVPSVIDEPGRMPLVALGGGQPLQAEGSAFVMGAFAYEEGVGLSEPRLHVAFQAAVQSLDLADQRPRLDAEARHLAVGPVEWPLQENHATLVQWTSRREDVPTIELSEALAQLEGVEKAKYAGKLVVIGDARGNDEYESEPFGRIPGSLFVANMLNTLLRPESARWVMLPDGAYYAFAALFATLAFCVAFLRRGFVSLAGVATAMAATWFAPVVLLHGFGRLQPSFSPTLACFMAAVLGLFAAQSPLFREDHRPAGIAEEATALFVDVRGSTALLRSLGPQAFRKVVAPFLGACDHIVAQHGGTVERTQGDGCLAIFRPRPGRHHSLRCADAVVELLAKAGEAERSTGRVLPIGIGFETGMVTGTYLRERGRRIWSSVGEAVNLAQRLQSASEGLGVVTVVGPVARRLIADEHSVRRLGAIDAKGFEEPVEVGTLDRSEKTKLFESGV